MATAARKRGDSPADQLCAQKWMICQRARALLVQQ
jgi:hypothetical protein